MSDRPGRRWDDGRLGAVLRVTQIVTSVIAIVALSFAIAALTETTHSRRESARDSCQLLRGLVYAATTKAPAQRTAAAAYIARTPLHDCNAYARQLIK
jgi:hypothetical protein